MGELGPQAAGLKRVEVNSADRIFQLLREGNMRRKTEATDANAVSSRSHAVLEIVVNRADRNNYQKNVFTGKLALVDLAGAERAHETNNHGQQLRDGANINRSLLALANCINALGKRKKKGFVFVPFRNSKLTRWYSRMCESTVFFSTRTCVLISLARSAYFSVLTVWLYCASEEATVAIITVRELPQSPSLSRRVSLEFRKGTKTKPFFLRFPSALMQLASASRLRLMLAPSRSCCPWLFVSWARSAPARSTSASFPVKTFFW